MDSEGRGGLGTGKEGDQERGGPGKRGTGKEGDRERGGPGKREEESREGDGQ